MGHIVATVIVSWLVLDAIVVVFLYLEKSRRPGQAKPQAEAAQDDRSLATAVAREREAMLGVARARARFRHSREEEAADHPLVLSPHAVRARRVRQRSPG